MIEWFQPLYVDEETKKKKRKIKRRLKQNKPVIGCYCIAFAQNEKDLFDMIEMNSLFFHYYKEKNLKILGLAQGKKNALQLVQQLIEEIYQQTGAFCVREYYRFPEGKQE